MKTAAGFVSALVPVLLLTVSCQGGGSQPVDLPGVPPNEEVDNEPDPADETSDVARCAQQRVNVDIASAAMEEQFDAAIHLSTQDRDTVEVTDRFDSVISTSLAIYEIERALRLQAVCHASADPPQSTIGLETQVNKYERSRQLLQHGCPTHLLDVDFGCGTISDADIETRCVETLEATGIDCGYLEVGVVKISECYPALDESREAFSRYNEALEGLADEQDNAWLKHDTFGEHDPAYLGVLWFAFDEAAAANLAVDSAFTQIINCFTHLGLAADASAHRVGADDYRTDWVEIQKVCYETYEALGYDCERLSVVPKSGQPNISNEPMPTITTWRVSSSGRSASVDATWHNREAPYENTRASLAVRCSNGGELDVLFVVEAGPLSGQWIDNRIPVGYGFYPAGWDDLSDAEQDAWRADNPQHIENWTGDKKSIAAFQPDEHHDEFIHALVDDQHEEVALLVKQSDNTTFGGFHFLTTGSYDHIRAVTEECGWVWS